jgi:CHASE2 domain-containing sensor protein
MKYYLLAIVAIAILIGCFWLFNQVDAWIGIIAFLLSAGGIVQFIINEIKKQTTK